MNKIAIARPIEGISLNGNEYVLNNSNEVMLFDNELDAIEFLQDNGCTEQFIDALSFVEYPVNN